MTTAEHQLEEQLVNKLRELKYVHRADKDASTQIPVCLWFLTKNTNTDAKRGFCDRRREMLFISHTSAPTLDQQPGIIDLWHT